MSKQAGVRPCMSYGKLHANNQHITTATAMLMSLIADTRNKAWLYVVKTYMLPSPFANEM